MILLVSNYSMSWCQSNKYFSTGELKQDSVLINVNAIKIANAKMIELKYEKEINKHLAECIRIDSTIIVSLQNNAKYSELKYKENINQIVKQRNRAILHGSITSGVLLFLLILL